MEVSILFYTSRNREMSNIHMFCIMQCVFPEQHGNTAMHYAARGGYLDLVRYLKQRKCDLNPLNFTVRFILFSFLLFVNIIILKYAIELV